MPSPQENPESTSREILRYFGGGALVILILMFVYIWAVNEYVGTENRGEFGDQFGAMGVLFSGLAFLGLVLTVAFQSRDLRAQTEALRLQQDALQLQIQEFKEQKEELARTAGAQERANELALLALHCDSLKKRYDLKIVESQMRSTSEERWAEVENAKLHILRMERAINDFGESGKAPGRIMPELPHGTTAPP